jgi:hypothetical protein
LLYHFFAKDTGDILLNALGGNKTNPMCGGSKIDPTSSNEYSKQKSVFFSVHLLAILSTIFVEKRNRFRNVFMN